MICPFDHIIYITNNLNRLTQEMLDFIQDKIDDNCTLTLENLQAQVRDEFGVDSIWSRLVTWLYFSKKMAGGGGGGGGGGVGVYVLLRFLFFFVLIFFFKCQGYFNRIYKIQGPKHPEGST